MADIVFRYPEMENAAKEIDELAGKYATAAKNLLSNFDNVTIAWEGESKTKMEGFMHGPVNDYVGVTVPKLLNSLAELLRANATQMQNADQQIADSIPTSI